MREGAAFCGACGAGLPAIAAAIDRATIQHLEVGAKGLLRVRVQNQGRPLTDLAVALTVDGAALAPTALGALATAGEALGTAWWTPEAPGYHELAGTLTAGEVSWRIAPVHVRVGGEKQPVAITIDQSSARVVDNSRATFGALASGELLGDGDWQPLALTIVTRPRAAALPPRPTFAPVAFAVTTARATYDLNEALARGDLATIYAGHERGRLGASAGVVLKLVDDRADNDLIQHEADTLALLRADAPGEVTPEPQRPTRHLPVVLDRMKTADGRVGSVLERIDGIDLVELRRRLAARGEGGLNPRHLIWLMRRVLSALGWAHARGVLHGNLDPAHILVRPHDHMVWVVDWCWAIVNPARTGQGFKAKNELYSPPEVAERKPPIPASDLYALGKCMFFVAGGDPATKTLPEHPDLDERLARFLRFLVSESPRGRPQDAVQLYLQVEKLREAIWGPHTFVTLDV
ncbi:MAG: hypothetical protein IT385_24380 [Deltaproteobacteria bacterium]|nr:hypothetical protein [Deltaproteobacteria bacterium]